MRSVSLWLLLVATAHGQISLQGKPVGPILNYYAAHPILAGDTNYCTQSAATYASGASAGTSVLNLNDGAGNRTISGAILCMFNDGVSTLAANSSVGFYRLTVLDMGSAANTTTVAINPMTSYLGPDNPVGWNSQCTSTGPARVCDWKTGKHVSVGGWMVAPLHRQENAASGVYYATGDSTLIASPDGGAHWCNVYTFANHATAPGCDSANWKADGDAPLPPSHGSYTANPSSIMWKEPTPYDGTSNSMGRLSFFDYCQDNACTGSPHGADTYLYGFGSTGQATTVILFRVPKNIASIMDVTAYQYYTCANYSSTNVCDGSVSGSWTSTLANATVIFAGTGGALNGGGQRTNPLPNGYTNHYGILYGSPTYYCANGGCTYAMMSGQVHLAAGQLRNNLFAFPAPWGPFTPPDREFSNPIFGFFNFLRYTLTTPDSTPYHAKFVMAGGNFSLHSSGTLYFQAYELTLGASQSGNSLLGCTPYRFTWSPAQGAIIRRGLWGFFDFFSHGCENNRVGNVYYAGLYANDLSTYPTNKQLLGCFTDGGVKCGNPNLGHALIYTPEGIYLGNSGYQTRLELRDMVPGVYNAVTASPFTSSADPEWTVSFAVKPNGIATLYQGLLQVGPAGHQVYIFNSFQSAGVIGVSWLYQGGAGSTGIRTTSAQLADGTWGYLTVTRAAGPITVCNSPPCSATVHFYLNGVEVGAQGVSGGGADLPTMAAGTHIVGASMDNNSFVGTFAALEMYSRALSKTEIQHNYLAQQKALVLRGINLPQASWQTAAAVITQPSISVTSTQALLAYTAPDSNACAVDISESPSYSPKVHDVDTGLFAGANLDSRASGVSSGTARIFVAGSRLPALALDAATVYSRALQANTLHYYRVACGAAVTAGTFTTANIPVGSTFNEPPPVNPAAPGGWLIPTRDGTRTQTIVDHHTGALLSPVSLPDDDVGPGAGSTGITIYDGAQIRACNPATHVDGGGNVGYLCNLNDQVGWHSLFYIVPATGESRHLGLIDMTPNVSVDDALQAYNISGSSTTRYNYTGAYAARAGGHAGAAQFDGGSTYNSTSIETLMFNFDPTFDVTKYVCSLVWAATGQYGFTTCRRSTQDSYGWMGIFSGTSKTIVAAWNTFIQQPTKFCGIHEFLMVPNNNVLEMNWHGLNPGDTTLGTATISTTTTGTATSGANTITVAGAPVSQAAGGDPVAAPAVTAGDKFRIITTGGTDYIVSSVAGNTWTFSPNLPGTVSAGAIVHMTCNAARSTDDGVWGITYWDFLNDIHGTDTTGTTVIVDTSIAGGGHMGWGPLGRVAESGGGYSYTPLNGGTVLSALNTTSVLIDSTAAYNGISPPGFGNLLTKHPAYHQTTTSPWFADSVAFAGGASGSSSGGRFFSADTGATLVSGSLYKYFPDTAYPLSRKLVPTQASNGIFSLRDISSPTTGDVIGIGAGDNYKYCVAYQTNECRTGSGVGDVYFNVPALTFAYCSGGDGPNPQNLDVCITNTPAYSGANMQFYLGTSSADSQSKSRNLTGGLVGPKNIKGSPLLKATPDGSYALFTIGSGDPFDVWKVKVPPLPAPDSVNRTAYIPTPVVVPAGPQSNVVVKFWYAENGYCTSRAENCYATAGTVPSGANPFLFPSDGSAGTLATVTGLSCAAGCTVAVPAISQRVLYYQIVYRDAANAIVSTGPVVVLAMP